MISKWTIRLLCIVALAVPVFSLRNGLFEFCTTKSYGFPLPVYTRYCLCMHRGGTEIYWTGVLFDLLFVAIPGLLLAKGIIFLQKRRRSVQA